MILKVLVVCRCALMLHDQAFLAGRQLEQSSGATPRQASRGANRRLIPRDKRSGKGYESNGGLSTSYLYFFAAVRGNRSASREGENLKEMRGSQRNGHEALEEGGPGLLAARGKIGNGGGRGQRHHARSCQTDWGLGIGGLGDYYGGLIGDWELGGGGVA
jgi:hypothetical protein